MAHKEVKTINYFTYLFLKTLVRSFVYFKLGYRIKNKYRIKKGESLVVLSNHQTDYDPILVHLSFSKLMRTVATDNIFRKGFLNWFITKLGGIPKRKGQSDLRSAMQMSRIIRDGGSLLIFPEGNRSYAEFQYYITDQIGKSLKNYKATIVLFNLHGGTGKYPRFAHKKRRGPFYGEIKKVLPYETYKDMSDEELTKTIKDNLKVYDSDSSALFKSSKRAEYLERMLFACPICNSHSTLFSKGKCIKCSCGLEVEYKENLHLTSSNPNFKFDRLIDWYNFQKEWIKNLEVNDKEIFFDNGVKLFNGEPHEKKRLLAKGHLSVNKDNLTIDKLSLPIKDIEIASPVSGRKLVFTHLGKAYVIKGNKRFNALKYMLLFNKLDTKMKNDKIDNYFTLEKEIS